MQLEDCSGHEECNIRNYPDDMERSSAIAQLLPIVEGPRVLDRARTGIPSTPDR